jgi:hypothetical protein
LGCPSISKSNRLHAVICWFFFINEVCSTKSSKMMGNCPEVFNFNKLFFKLNWFLCNVYTKQFTLQCQHHLHECSQMATLKLCSKVLGLKSKVGWGFIMDYGGITQCATQQYFHGSYYAPLGIKLEQVLGGSIIVVYIKQRNEGGPMDGT